MGKEIVNQVQEAQTASGRVNLRRNTLRHIIIKLQKLKTELCLVAQLCPTLCYPMDCSS